MRNLRLLFVVAVVLALPGVLPAQEKLTFPRFRMQEIATDLKVGYGVLLVDLNEDGKLDIVVVDTNRVVWYENPTWRMRVILQGQTKPDNVCIAAHDIDGDGHLDLALGADWRPADTKSSGSIHWLKRGASLDEPWKLHDIGAEPTVHRMRFADMDGDGKAELLVMPLQGRNCTAKGNWTDGEPVRILSYSIPKDPTKDRWVPNVLNQGLFVIHNFQAVPAAKGQGQDLLTASYEGVHRFARTTSSTWTGTQIGEGNQANPKSNRGASEIKQGKLASAPFIGTVEPWHGHQVVVYTPPADGAAKLWTRRMLDDQLRWGHAVWCADLDNDGTDELLIGVRDNLTDEPGKRRGVRIYKATDKTGSSWQRHILEDGGVATEDLAAADLNGDGRIDIVAVGRQTHNIRIYWQE